MFNGARGINPYFFMGVVVDKNDPINEGRVRVMCFGIHPTETSPSPQDMLNTVDKEDLPWATCINGTYGAIHTIPDEGEWVFGFFIDGRDAQHPMILGTIPGTNTEDWTAPAGSAQPNNTVSGNTSATPNSTIAGQGGPAVNSAARADLDNDPEFQARLDTFLQNHPEMSREEVYNIMAGESGFNSSAVSGNGQYGGLFQLGQASTGQDGTYIASLSPAQQLDYYDSYLTNINYRGGGLGMYQAAPGVVNNYLSRTGATEVPDNLVLYVRSEAQRQELAAQGYITEYAYAGFGNSVYNQNSSGGYNTTVNGTGWVGTDGVITAGSVNSYYDKG